MKHPYFFRDFTEGYDVPQKYAEKFLELQEREKNCPFVYNQPGWKEYNEKIDLEYAEMEKNLHSAKQNNPSTELEIMLAYLYSHSEDYENALKILRELSEKTGDPKIYYLTGYCFSTLANNIMDYENAGEEHDSVEPHHRQLIDLSNYNLHKAEDICDKDSELYYLILAELGANFFTLKHYGLAEEKFLSYKNKYPDDYGIYRLLGFLYEEQGELDKAIESFELSQQLCDVKDKYISRKINELNEQIRK